MSDRELLESLGYKIIEDDPEYPLTGGEYVVGGYILISPRGERSALGILESSAESSISEYVANPNFFLELDDALAAKGWDSELHRIGKDFYRYIVGPYLATGTTPLAAVRPVYERIWESEHTEAIYVIEFLTDGKWIMQTYELERSTAIQTMRDFNHRTDHEWRIRKFIPEP
ncbi:hypothetical protein KGP36_01850 [Patescibacteria group bacterium]|nr:hypothetical protein [Patescibacteria group bacterium]